MSINNLNKVTQSLKFKEIKINLPYGGHLSGKWWGNRSVRPFVCLHGYLDNCGSFDRLIPLLSEEFSYLAIDFPGHGKSSWLPKGATYHTNGLLHLPTVLMNEFKWDKISFISHSLGTHVAFVYAAIHPDKVDMMITIEAFKPLKRETQNLMMQLQNLTEKVLIADQRNQNGIEPPSYTIEEITELLIKSTFGSVTKETAKYLYERNIEPSVKFPGKFFFSRDNRMKLNLDLGLYQDVSIDLLKKIKIPFFFIKAAKAFLYEKRIYYEEGLEVMKNVPFFEYFLVDSSSHHLHLTEPEKIAPKINNFIQKYKTKISHL
ncbi:hypothetical protein PVAND_002103 [Polypedilum vanderplanki]|uniref:AB hydrolase-1 domain-containing protein n=1 Tax=Polypedilum vanderplanki TaxID=319348 RepID=A0A9J6BQ99_POLVA|nr:hypothetical protein PVAND_002103 [Polypedilum vanderplanki]